MWSFPSRLNHKRDSFNAIWDSSATGYRLVFTRCSINESEMATYPLFAYISTFLTCIFWFACLSTRHDRNASSPPVGIGPCPRSFLCFFHASSSESTLTWTVDYRRISFFIIWLFQGEGIADDVLNVEYKMSVQIFENFSRRMVLFNPWAEKGITGIMPLQNHSFTHWRRSCSITKYLHRRKML